MISVQISLWESKNNATLSCCIPQQNCTSREVECIIRALLAEAKPNIIFEHISDEAARQEAFHRTGQSRPSATHVGRLLSLSDTPIVMP